MGAIAYAGTVAGRRASAWPTTPEEMTVSTAHGRCGPCCSIEPVASTITVFSRSGSAAISVQLR